MATFNSGVPQGDLKDKWTQYKDSINLVNPANKRNIDVIVVGTGLAGIYGGLTGKNPFAAVGSAVGSIFNR